MQTRLLTGLRRSIEISMVHTELLVIYLNFKASNSFIDLCYNYVKSKLVSFYDHFLSSLAELFPYLINQTRFLSLFYKFSLAVPILILHWTYFWCTFITHSASHLLTFCLFPTGLVLNYVNNLLDGMVFFSKNRTTHHVF